MISNFYFDVGEYNQQLTHCLYVELRNLGKAMVTNVSSSQLVVPNKKFYYWRILLCIPHQCLAGVFYAMSDNCV